MHPNPRFRSEDANFHEALVNQVGFGMVFAQTPDGPRVAHTPILFDEDGTARFHLARGNALTRHLPETTALIVANGPETYVSPRWYADPDQVPTWNFVSAELEGQVSRIERGELVELLERLSQRHESRVEHGTIWTLDKMSDKHFSRLLDAIVGFKMDVRKKRETVKLSQNKPQAEIDRVIHGLRREGEIAVAELMEEATR